MKVQMLKIQSLQWQQQPPQSLITTEVEEEVEVQVITHLSSIHSLPSNKTSLIPAQLIPDQRGQLVKSVASLDIQLQIAIIGWLMFIKVNIHLLAAMATTSNACFAQEQLCLVDSAAIDHVTSSLLFLFSVLKLSLSSTVVTSYALAYKIYFLLVLFL